MLIQENTKDGLVERELSEEEISVRAELGDMQAKQHKAKQARAAATSIEQRVSIIEEFLGINQ